MTRVFDPGTESAASAGRIRLAAIALFKQGGYHGTSMRDLANAVQMEAASLYYHYPSKQHILDDLMHRTMDSLIAGFEQAVAAHADTTARLEAALRFHVDFHVRRRDEAFVSHSELRALTPDNLRRIVVKRDRYEAMLRALLVAGCDEGRFEIGDPALAGKAVLMMCSGVSDWFGPGGRLSGDQIGDGYAHLVLRMVGARRVGPA